MPTSTSQRPAVLPACPLHPGSLVRPYRTSGPDGPSVYPQCIPDDAPPHLLSWHPGDPHEPAMLVDATLLSISERQVLDDAALGLTVSQTARKRLKGTETVKAQRKAILTKLGAKNMAHAVALILRSEAEEERHAA
jgi:DNA-binding CsgD family transcriptional regulator